MSTDLVKQAAQGGLTAFNESNNPFLKRSREEGVTDGVYLRMNGTTGKFMTSGGMEFAPGSQFVFNIYDAVEGWEGFDKQKKNHKGPSSPMLSGASPKEPDPVPGVEWKLKIRLLVATLDGGPQMTLTSNADKPSRAIRKLILQYGKEMSRNRDDKGRYKMPIVEIGSHPFEFDKDVDKVHPETKEVYQEKEHFKIWFEDFKIVEWIGIDDMTAIRAAYDEQHVADMAAAEASADTPKIAPPTATPTPPPAETAAPPAATSVVQQALVQAQSGFRRGRVGERVS